MQLKLENGKLLETTISDQSLFLEEEDQFLVPDADNGQYVVYQASGYQSQSDELAEGDRDEDNDQFVQTVSLLRGKSSASEVFKDRISTANIFSVAQLKNKSFITKMGTDRYGDIKVKEVDEAFSAGIALQLSEAGCKVSSEMVLAAIDAYMAQS